MFTTDYQGSATEAWCYRVKQSRLVVLGVKEYTRKKLTSRKEIETNTGRKQQAANRYLLCR